jgi:hypothetical protein
MARRPGGRDRRAVLARVKGTRWRAARYANARIRVTRALDPHSARRVLELGRGGETAFSTEQRNVFGAEVAGPAPSPSRSWPGLTRPSTPLTRHMRRRSESGPTRFGMTCCGGRVKVHAGWREALVMPTPERTRSFLLPQAGRLFSKKKRLLAFLGLIWNENVEGAVAGPAGKSWMPAFAGMTWRGFGGPGVGLGAGRKAIAVSCRFLRFLTPSRAPAARGGGGCCG